MIFLKKLCVMAVAAAMAAAGLNCSVSASEADASGGGTDVIVLANGNNSESPVLANTYGGYDSENARMFDNTWKMQPESNANYAYGTNNTGIGSLQSINLNDEQYKDYKYINYWMYSSKDLSSGGAADAPTLSLLLKRRASNTSMCYHTLPADWQGWRLITLEIKNDSVFKKRYSNESWESLADLCGWNIVANPTSAAHSQQVYDERVVWNNSPDDYICIDYIYLSKEIPAAELAVLSASVEDGASDVPPALEDNNTISFTFNQELKAESAHPDRIQIIRNGERMESGYNASVDETDRTKLNIVFDNALDAGGEYSISVGGDCVYDNYGYTLQDTYTVAFKVSSKAADFKVINSSPANGAVNVPIDTHEFTMSFTNPPNTEGIEDNIALIAAGVPIPTGGYSVRVDGNTVIINVEDDLLPGKEYAVEFPESFTDIYGNRLTGERYFSFTSMPEPAEYFTIADFSNEEEYGLLGMSLSASADADGTNATAAIVSHPQAMTDGKALVYNVAKGSWTQAHGNYGASVLTGKFGHGDGVDLTVYEYKDYKYINYWIYSDSLPIPSGDNAATLNLFISNSINGETKRLTYILPVDWDDGWRLVSIPISSFSYGDGTGSLNAAIRTFGITTNYTSYGGVRWPDGGTVMLDRIFLSKKAPGTFRYKGCGTPEGYGGIPVRDAELYFEYSGTVTNISKENLLITKDNEPITDFEVYAAGSRIYVRFTADLDAGAQYCVRIDEEISDISGQKAEAPAVYSFTASDSGLAVGKPVFTDSDGELPSKGDMVNAAADISNQSDKDRVFILTVAAYNRSGTMTSIERVSEIIGAGESAALSAQTEWGMNTEMLRAFVCDENGKPLRPDYSVLGTEASNKRIYSPSAKITDILTLTETEINTNELFVSGEYGGADAVFINIENEAGAEILTVPVYSDSTGKYSYKYTFDKTADSGVYIINVSASGVKTCEKSVQYINEELRDDILESVNRSEKTEEIIQILDENKNGLEISELNEAQILGIAEILLEQKPYTKYEDIVLMIGKAVNCMEALNSCKWNALSAFLALNHEIVLCGNQYYSTYTGLSEKARNSINQKIVSRLPVESFSQFRSIFGTEVKNYVPDNQNGSGSPGGPGGSGGSGGSNASRPGTSVTMPGSVLAEHNPRNSNSESTKNIFADVNDNHWAKSYIEELYGMNILSMSDDGSFRPDDGITREEFIKMLVLALGIEPINQNSGFTDTEDEAWYQPYLSAARKAGITDGRTDGSFGIGELITREDISVMAYRGINAAGKELTDTASAEEFADKSNIADYAIDAVSTMRSAGIIDGMGENRFCPKEKSLRSQAAKIVCGLIKILQ